MILEGTVTGITKFGAFVSLEGGRSGMVHISEVSTGYVTEIRDFLTEGQQVKVKVLGIDERGRINLSVKQAMVPPRAGAGSVVPVPEKKSMSFEDMLSKFKQDSEEKLSDIRSKENHRASYAKRSQKY